MKTRVEVEDVKWDDQRFVVKYKTVCTPYNFDLTVDGIVYGSKEWRDKYIGKYWYTRLGRKLRIHLDNTKYYFGNLWKAIKGDYNG